MPLPPDAHVFKTDEAHLVALWRDVFVTAWWGETTLASLRGVGGYQHDVLKRKPGGFVALALITSSSVNMPADVRAEAERLSRGAPPELRAVAQVIQGTGFVGAAVRGVATGMLLLTRQARPSKIFDTLEPASRWLAPLADPRSHTTASELVHATRELVSHATGKPMPW